jgi:phenylacetate-coenzyme A ligase PaaK-like adenylate-forming protein
VPGTVLRNTFRKEPGFLGRNGMERKNITKENSYFTKDLETMPIEQIKKLQFEKTKETLKKAYHKSQFYHELFDRAKVKPEDCKTLEDIISEGLDCNINYL